jgi:hypothetical protein
MAGCKTVAALALVLLASGPLNAQQTRSLGGLPDAPVTPPAGESNFYLNSIGAGNILGGVYTSPYDAVINPTTINSNGSYTGGTSIPVICDDFADNTYTDEDWNTIVTNLSSITSLDTTLKFGDTNSVTVNDQAQATNLTISGYGLNTVPPLTQLQAYDAAALLAIDIFNLTDDSANAAQLGGFSYAMWALFDTTDALGQLTCTTGPNCPANMAGETLAIEDLYGVVNEVLFNSNAANATLANYNINIYTYDKQSDPSCYNPAAACPTQTPQEFIAVSAVASVPEASSLASFLVYFLLGGASLLFFGRRRIFSARS